MYYKLLSLIAAAATVSISTAQQEIESNVPPAIRAMLEQQQRGNPFEQMAQMQVSAQYGELLRLFDEGRRSEIEAAMITVFGQRMELSSQMTTANANPTELARISTSDYLREELSNVLSRQELQLFDDFHSGTSERQLRNTYGEQLAQAAPAVTEANREVVLDTMVEHMLLERTDISDPEAMITAQLQSLMNVRAELETRLDPAQFMEADRFLNQVRSNLYRNRDMYEAMQEQ